MLHLYSNVAKYVVSTLFLEGGGDQEWSNTPGLLSIGAVAIPWPAVPLFPPNCQEQEARGLLLPHHLPEILHCVG